jgi:hypothetical protein
LAAPVTVNDAAVGLPVTAGRVQPPVVDLTAAGVITTVPALELTATLPKFKAAVLAIAIGPTIVAEAVDVDETWANIDVEAINTITLIAAKVLIVFIFTQFLVRHLLVIVWILLKHFF